MAAVLFYGGIDFFFVGLVYSRRHSPRLDPRGRRVRRDFGHRRSRSSAFSLLASIQRKEYSVPGLSRRLDHGLFRYYERIFGRWNCTLGALRRFYLRDLCRLFSKTNGAKTASFRIYSQPNFHHSHPDFGVLLYQSLTIRSDHDRLDFEERTKIKMIVSPPKI